MRHLPIPILPTTPPVHTTAPLLTVFDPWKMTKWCVVCGVALALLLDLWLLGGMSESAHGFSASMSRDTQFLMWFCTTFLLGTGLALGFGIGSRLDRMRARSEAYRVQARQTMHHHLW